MKRYLSFFLITLFLAGCSQEPQTIEELTKAGEQAFVAGDYEKAKKYLAEGLLKKSSDREILYLLGVSFSRQYQYDSALYYLKRADLLHPLDRQINLEIYTASKQVQDYDNAIKAIDVLIKTGDAQSKYLGELADLNLRAGNIFVSFLQLRKLWEEQGQENPNMYLALANLAAQVDSVDMSIRIMKQAIDKFGFRDELVSNYAVYLAGANRLSEAETVLIKMIPLSSNPDAVRLNLANILTLSDKRKKKIEAYHIYKDLYTRLGNVLKLDSTVTALKEELNL